MTYLKPALVIFSAMLFVFASQAQPKHGNLTHFSEGDGLPGLQVNEIIVDTFGYIWIGSINGLARYDGYEFKRFYNDPNDPGSMRGVIIETIFEDSKGRIWVSSASENLNVYDPATQKFSHFSYKHLIDHPARVEIRIHAISEDLNGRLYFGVTATRQDIPQALLYLDEPGDGLQLFETQDSLQITNVYRSISDKAGNIWLLSWNGIFRIDTRGNSTRIATLDDEFARNNEYITDIKPTTDGHFWLVSNKFNLYMLNPDNGVYKVFSNTTVLSATDNDFFAHLLPDNKGNVWINSNLGLHYFDQLSTSFKRPEADLFRRFDNMFISALRYDAFGTLWLGTRRDGLFKYEEKSLFRSYGAEQDEATSLLPGWVNNLSESRSGKIWITTSGPGNNAGLSIFNPQTGTFRSIPFHVLQPGADIIFGLKEVRQDEFYLSTPAGVFLFSANSNTLEKVELTGISDDAFVTYFLDDSYGNFWLGSTDGLFRREKGESRFRKYDLSYAVGVDYGSNHIMKLFESNKHGLWILTNWGLYLYDYATDKIARHGFDSQKGDVFISQDINSFYEDEEGIAWIGLWQGGLSRYNVATGAIKTYTRNDGLPSMGVQGILPDPEIDILWLSTFEGLSSFNTITGQFQNFYTPDGIQGQMFAEGAYLKTSQGLLVFGGSNGITVFMPEDVRRNSLPPRVFLTGIKINNQVMLPGENAVLKYPVYDTEAITLNHDQNSINIAFAALHYSDPKRNKILYKLENHDTEWRTSGGLFDAFYPKLRPGDYVFHVKAANSHGIWNEEGATLKIRIKTPWWMTLWAYAAYALLLIIAGYRTNRYIRARIVKKEREKSQAKELAQAREIEKAYEDLKATQTQLIQAEKMASLGELTAGIAHEIQNPLNFVNNFAEVSIEMIDEVREEIPSVEEIPPVEKIHEFSLQTFSQTLDEIKQNLEKIHHHGKRADAIVKGMLQHSRSSTGQKELTDLNALADEYLRLAYHGLRAKDKSFNAAFHTDFDPDLPKIEVVPQDIGRVILNLVNNAFQSVHEKSGSVHVERQGLASLHEYTPTVTITTQLIANSQVLIAIKDNGNGIPEHIRDKIFQPFFTTKPTGQGTGLGLSLSYDIVKAHGGILELESRPGETIFKFILNHLQ